MIEVIKEIQNRAHNAREQAKELVVVRRELEIKAQVYEDCAKMLHAALNTEVNKVFQGNEVKAQEARLSPSLRGI